MIEHFDIPPGALINMPISKKLFAEKTTLSAIEKRLLRDEIDRIEMKALLQTRTFGVASYVDDHYAYDQIIFAEVHVKNRAKASVIATMVQRAFPAPMILLLHEQDNYCISWCVKRINQADKTKRVMEDQQITRFFKLEENDIILKQWLSSLSVSEIECVTLKDLFDQLSARLFLLKVSDETGCFSEPHVSEPHVVYYRSVLSELNANRSEQMQVKKQLKEETQFNRIVKLNTTLRELQDEELNLKERLRKKEKEDDW